MKRKCLNNEKSIVRRFGASAAIFITSCSSEVKDVAKKIKDPVFRAYCVSSMDLDGDRKLSLSEADSVKSIDVSGLEIKSLAGLEYFRNLKSLDFSGTRVESFAFQLPALEMFKCANNENLAALDLTGCPSLSFCLCVAHRRKVGGSRHPDRFVQALD